MTNTALILSNEQSNDGQQIHLYYNSSAGVWMSYGYSAYALRLCIKSVGLDNLRTYSNELQLPCTKVGTMTANRVRKVLDLVEENEGVYMQFRANEVCDQVDYQSWVKRLQEERAQKSSMWVETPVSQFVPKDKFIPDAMTSFERNIKRLIDMLGAGVALIVFSPLWLFCYVAIKLEDRGPAIFKQERIGRFGRPFHIYKFRSMRLDAEKFGPQLSHSGGDNDPRLTKVGRFIRAHHLDELPQLWNVFCGDMAFVGPRPERKFYIDQILEYDKRYAYLYQIRPGVTSYATLYNGYTDTMEKMLRRLEYDLYYLGHRSWWFDFKVLFNTFCAIVFGKKF